MQDLRDLSSTHHYTGPSRYGLETLVSACEATLISRDDDHVSVITKTGSVITHYTGQALPVVASRETLANLMSSEDAQILLTLASVV